MTKDAMQLPRPQNLTAALSRGNPAPDSRFLLLWDVKHGQCRFGLGDPLDIEAFRFCAAPTVGESSWCRHHMALVYTPGERRRAA
jgi:hypothetical protein